MATTLSTAQRDPRSVGFLSLAVLTSAAQADDAAAPVITSGSGAASASDTDGSLRLRTDGAPEFRVGSAWVAPLLGDGSVSLSGALQLTDGDASGAVVRRVGATATEGMELVVVDTTVSPAAVETAVFTVPAGAVIRAVQANVETALTGGGTTVTFALGTAADPDKYGYPGSDTLAQDAKIDTIPAHAVLASTEPIVLTGAATGGTADGDTALTVGSVRVRLVYEQLNSLDDA